MSGRWSWTTSYDWPRWQFDGPDGMMFAIVERPGLEISDLWIPIPVGWWWRNSWAGASHWTPTRKAAMLAAEQAAYTAPDVYPYDPDEPDA